ncbi:hypothetical protein [Planctomyces sp. SH-PL14]|uniref:hypothetical protein n=1 Tax=Planctomyces sp. SH-PL14 TaxID=1632864 RepID=UPI00078BD8D8|nr:hypothetical protein [Planctomyces sp. SH-PL14]AMV16830.1 hypothetical protein VT03_03000 [Planctomyces sp. SH-PL14]
MSNDFLIVVLLHAVLAVALVVVLARDDRRKTAAKWLQRITGVAGVLLLIPFGDLLAAAVLLATSIICIVGRTFDWTSRRMAIVSGTAMLGLFSFYWIIYVAQVRSLDRLREDYPLVSLAPRLAHESSRSLQDTPDLMPEVRKTLDATEEFLDRDSWRSHALELLHSRASHEFVSAPGFGVTRMRRPSRLAVVLKEEPPEPLPSAPPAIVDYRTESEPAANAKSLRTKHFGARDHFLDGRAFGFVRNRDQVAGFEAHAFRRPFAPEVETDTKPVAWKVTSLQLVSLLKFEAPQVYDTPHFPDMVELVGVPTRSLTPFESDSLPKLATQEDVVIEPGQNRIEMLGSLRASKTCTACHSVPEGTLLGAFTYVISRFPAAAEAVSELR